MTDATGAAPSPEFTKLSAKIYPPVLWAFDRQLTSALLRRDAFLDRVIGLEISSIEADLKGQRNTDPARRHISRCLSMMGGSKTGPLHPISIAVRKTTAEALRRVVDEHNLCRDSLINWIIVLLRSTDALLDALELPKEVSGSWTSGLSRVPTSPLGMIEAAQWDPFFYLRSACEARHGCGLYNLPLPPQLMGFQCVLDEDRVPNTEAFKQREARDAEMFALLSDFEDAIRAPKAATEETNRG